MKKILFWPGRGKSSLILKFFLKKLKSNFNITIFPFEYDVGDYPFHSKSNWCNWLNKNYFDWWCGISLGASFLLKIVSSCTINTPNRMTLINPFYSRIKLAHEKDFSLNGQWNIELNNFTVQYQEVDMVVSMYDEKIPIYHGLHLLNQLKANDKRLVLIEASHQINNEVVQIELAEILQKFDGKNYDAPNFKYCYIYK